MTSGGASRSTSGRGALMMKPASRAASATAAATGAVEDDAAEQPAAADAGDQRVVQRRHRADQVLPHRGGVVEQAVPLDHGDHREPGDGRDRVAAEGAAVAARAEQGRRPAGRQAGADREAVAQALGHGDDVGLTPSADVHQPAPVRPIPVCTSSIQSRAPCRSQISRAAAR